MMTDFYDKGDYHVRGDRWDECPAFYGADIMEQWLWISSFFIVLWSVIASSILWNLDKLASQLWAMFGATYLVLCSITIFWIWNNSGKCGMSIILYNRRNNIILQRFYHFTNNPSYDAMKVAQMIHYSCGNCGYKEQRPYADEWDDTEPIKTEKQQTLF